MMSRATRHEPDPIRDSLRALRKVGVITRFGDVRDGWQISFPGDRGTIEMTDDHMTAWIDGAMAGLQATGYPITTEESA